MNCCGGKAGQELSDLFKSLFVDRELALTEMTLMGPCGCSIGAGPTGGSAESAESAVWRNEQQLERPAAVAAENKWKGATEAWDLGLG